MAENLWTDLADQLAALDPGFTPENVANKDTDGTFAANSDVKYPSQKATKTYVDAKFALAGTGDVVGPASSVDGRIALFDGATGKLLKVGANVLADFQPIDGDLTAIAAIAPSNDDIIQRKAGAWVNRTMAQLRTDLALVIGTNVQAWDADLDAIAALAGTSGLLKKTAANTWSLDTAVYATQAYADALVVGLLDDRGNYNASGNTFPASGGSGAAGAILKGDLWTISVAGTLGGHPVTAGDVVRALVDTPGQTDGNWAIGENNFGYVALNQALADGKIYVGNGSGIGTAVTPTGDVTISNAGVTAIAADVIVNADINSSAAIDATKIADGSVTNAEFQFINTLSSNAQTQISGKQPLDSTLTALAAYNTNGLLVQTAADTFTGRSVAVHADANLSITNGDGVAGNPTLNTIQGIKTSSAPQFARLGLGVAADGAKLLYANSGATPTDSQAIFRANALGGFSVLVYSADNIQNGFDADWTGSAWIARHTSAARQIKNADRLTFSMDGGLTIGNSFTPTDRLHITTAGNIKIAGTANRGTTEGTNQLVIFNGTAPVGTLANGIALYSTAGELRVMDAAGNPTLLSPHDNNNWIFDSYVGKGKNRKHLIVDMEKMVRFLNRHFGANWVHEYEAPYA